MNGQAHRATDQTARQRLADIGHHFLSDAPAFMTFHLVTRRDDTDKAFAIGLARQMARLGRTVVMPDQEFETLLYYCPSGELAGSAQHLNKHRETPRHCDVMIITASDCLRQATNVLMTVPSHPEDMRSAWIDLKTLVAGRQSGDNVGVTMIDADNPRDAEHAFDRFATAARQFLDIELNSYACLTRNRQDHDRQLRNIATLLLADGTPG